MEILKNLELKQPVARLNASHGWLVILVLKEGGESY